MRKVLLKIILVLCLYACSGSNQSLIEGDCDNEALLKRDIYVFQQSAIKNRSDPRALLALGWSEMDRKNNEHSIKYFNQALKIQPDLAIAYLGLGQAYEAISHDDFAIIAYQQAINLEQNWHFAQFKLGSLYKKNGQLPKALEILDFLIANNKELADKLVDVLY